MTKYLGKITFAEFGVIHDTPFLMGLQLFFKLSDGCQIGCGGKYTVNVSPSCKWTREEREHGITVMVNKVHDILKDAKVDYVSDLVGKPVEVTVENGMFKDFRILTEVL